VTFFAGDPPAKTSQFNQHAPQARVKKRMGKPWAKYQGCCKVGNKSKSGINQNLSLVEKGEVIHFQQTKGLFMNTTTISSRLILPNQALLFDARSLV